MPLWDKRLTPLNLYAKFVAVLKRPASLTTSLAGGSFNSSSGAWLFVRIQRGQGMALQAKTPQQTVPSATALTLLNGRSCVCARNRTCRRRGTDSGGTCAG